MFLGAPLIGGDTVNILYVGLNPTPGANFVRNGLE